MKRQKIQTRTQSAAISKCKCTPVHKTKRMTAHCRAFIRFDYIALIYLTSHELVETCMISFLACSLSVHTSFVAKCISTFVAEQLPYRAIESW